MDSFRSSGPSDKIKLLTGYLEKLFPNLLINEHQYTVILSKYISTIITVANQIKGAQFIYIYTE